MRQITKDITAPPAALTSNNCKRQLKNIVATKKGKNSTYYHKKTVVNALNIFYKNKCGYCESRIHVVASENVEHYRPKAGVDEIDLVAGTNHIGYYWMANEWSNLLIACPKCNQQGNKGNRFPLQVPASRVYNHPALLASGEVDLVANRYNSPHIAGEVPLLINPEHKDPIPEFLLKRNGDLDKKNNSVFAEKTIEVCDLNRQPLSTERQKIIDGITNKINRQIKEWKSNVDPLTDAQFKRQLEIIFSEIISRLKDEREYTFVAKMMIKYFDTLVLSGVETKFHETIQKHFNDFINSN
jgi:5-methylcytosine-specific restriction endonuclease McrA